MKRRSFITQTTATGLGALLPLAAVSSCKDNNKENDIQTIPAMTSKPLQLSLAQWSLNRAFFGKTLDPNDFARIAANDYGIEAIEYVNQFYVDHAKDEAFWNDMKRRADDVGVKSLLIMVDDEGDLGDPDDQARKIAAQNHFKWVNAAKLLGCHSIRVNAFGDGTKDQTRQALIDGMSILLDYAAKENINILIENHGLYSSDGAWVAGIIKEVDQSNFGTLPDFGNWCLNEKWGSTQNNKCTEVYNRAQGLKDFLPYAKGVSAKSYQFDEKGDETTIDYKELLHIVKTSEFDGYIGIEYEGEDLSESEGIRSTKRLITKLW